MSTPAIMALLLVILVSFCQFLSTNSRDTTEIYRWRELNDDTMRDIRYFLSGNLTYKELIMQCHVCINCFNLIEENRTTQEVQVVLGEKVQFDCDIPVPNYCSSTPTLWWRKDESKVLNAEESNISPMIIVMTRKRDDIREVSLITINNVTEKDLGNYTCCVKTSSRRDHEIKTVVLTKVAEPNGVKVWPGEELVYDCDNDVFPLQLPLFEETYVKTTDNYSEIFTPMLIKDGNKVNISDNINVITDVDYLMSDIQQMAKIHTTIVIPSGQYGVYSVQYNRRLYFTCRFQVIQDNQPDTSVSFWKEFHRDEDLPMDDLTGNSPLCQIVETWHYCISCFASLFENQSDTHEIGVMEGESVTFYCNCGSDCFRIQTAWWKRGHSKVYDSDRVNITEKMVLDLLSYPTVISELTIHNLTKADLGLYTCTKEYYRARHNWTKVIRREILSVVLKEAEPTIVRKRPQGWFKHFCPHFMHPVAIYQILLDSLSCPSDNQTNTTSNTYDMDPILLKDGKRIDGHLLGTIEVNSMIFNNGSDVFTFLNIYNMTVDHYGVYSIQYKQHLNFSCRIKIMPDDLHDPNYPGDTSPTPDVMFVPKYVRIPFSCVWKSKSPTLYSSDPHLMKTPLQKHGGHHMLCPSNTSINFDMASTVLRQETRYKKNGIFVYELNAEINIVNDDDFGRYECMNSDNVHRTLLVWPKVTVTNTSFLYVSNSMNQSVHFTFVWNSTYEKIFKEDVGLYRRVEKKVETVPILNTTGVDIVLRKFYDEDHSLFVVSLDVRLYGLNTPLQGMLYYFADLGLSQQIVYIYEKISRSAFLGSTVAVHCFDVYTVGKSISDEDFELIKDGNRITSNENRTYKLSHDIVAIDGTTYVTYEFNIELMEPSQYGLYTCNISGNIYNRGFEYTASNYTEQATWYAKHFKDERTYSKSLLIAIIILAEVFFAVVFISAVVFGCAKKQRIEYRKKRFQELKWFKEFEGYDAYKHEGVEYKYDVYISHCEEDEGWVCDELVPKLENDFGLAVYLDIRDCRGGKQKLTNIAEGINKSRKYIAVFSPQYLDNKYCIRYEQFLAYTKLLSEDGPSDSYKIIMYRKCAIPLLLEESSLSWEDPKTNKGVVRSAWNKIRRNPTEVDKREIFWMQVREWIGPPLQQRDN